MKRILIIICALFALCAGAAAQETWFCSEPGTTLSYSRTEVKSGATSTYDYVIKDKTVEEDRTTIVFDVVVPGQPVASDCKVWVENGMFYNDVRAALGQFGNGVAAKGTSPVLPDAPYIGQTLKDCSIYIDDLMLASDYKKIKFTANKDITVPAGTFNCWCLEFDVVDSAMGLKARSHVQQWLAKGVGEVKSVTKDSNGRVLLEKSLMSIAK